MDFDEYTEKLWKEIPKSKGKLYQMYNEIKLQNIDEAYNLFLLLYNYGFQSEAQKEYYDKLSILFNKDTKCLLGEYQK